MRSVRWECGQSARVGCECDGVVNKCTYCVYTVRCTRNGHGIHGHSSQQNTLRRTPSTAREARSERPRPATTNTGTRLILLPLPLLLLLLLLLLILLSVFCLTGLYFGYHSRFGLVPRKCTKEESLGSAGPRFHTSWICSSCHPTNSVKAIKGYSYMRPTQKNSMSVQNF